MTQHRGCSGDGTWEGKPPNILGGYNVNCIGASQYARGNQLRPPQYSTASDATARLFLACECARVCVRVYVHIHIHAYIHAYVHTCMYAHTRV